MQVVDHTAIVVEDLDEALRRWEALTGAQLEIRQIVAHQRVEIAMLRLGDTRLELIRPTDSDSGVARFLAKRGEGLHHIAFRVDDIVETLGELIGAGYRVIDSQPRPGAHGLVAFLHPTSTGGVLVELIQPAPDTG